jgi:hypothetical protein
MRQGPSGHPRTPARPEESLPVFSPLGALKTVLNRMNGADSEPGSEEERAQIGVPYHTVHRGRETRDVCSRRRGGLGERPFEGVGGSCRFGVFGWNISCNLLTIGPMADATKASSDPSAAAHLVLTLHISAAGTHCLSARGVA